MGAAGTRLWFQAEEGKPCRGGARAGSESQNEPGSPCCWSSCPDKHHTGVKGAAVTRGIPLSTLPHLLPVVSESPPPNLLQGQIWGDLSKSHCLPHALVCRSAGVWLSVGGSFPMTHLRLCSLAKGSLEREQLPPEPALSGHGRKHPSLISRSKMCLEITQKSGQ